MNIAEITAAALEKDCTLVGARLLSEAMRFSIMAERESNPTEKAALERRALNLLRQACKIEWGTA